MDASSLAATTMRAEDPSTPASELERLSRSRSRAVRGAVAANPNSPLDVLAVLGRNFPDVLANNPILDWLLLEDANWLGQFDSLSRCRLLMEPGTALGLLWWAARFGTPDDKLAVAQNPNCPIELLSYLANIGHPELSACVGAHVNAPHPLGEHSGNPPDGAPNEATGVSSATGREGPRPNNVYTTDLHIGRTITLANGSASAADIATLIDLGSVPAESFDLLVDGDVLVRRAVARSPLATPDVLRILLVDDDVDTRTMALDHNAAPRAVVDAVHKLVANDPTVDLHVFDGLPVTTFLEMHLARHPNCDRTVLLDIVDSGNWRLREAAASNLGLPIDIAILLAADTDKDVRVSLVRNPRVPPYVCDWLVDDRVDEVAKAAGAASAVRQAEGDGGDEGPTSADEAGGQNLLIELLLRYRHVGVILGRLPSITEQMLSDLAADSDWQIRRSCATNPNLPTVILEQLLRDSDSDVRIAALANSNTTAEIVAKVADPTHAEVRCRLVRDTANPVALGTYAHDSVLAVREALAEHPATSSETLQLLAVDSDSSVREIVAGRNDLTKDLLTKLAADTEPRVQQRVAERDGELSDAAIVGLFHDLRRTPLAKRANLLRTLLQGSNELKNSELRVLKQAPSWVRQHIVRRATSDSFLSAMARSEDWYTRVAVAEHPLASESILRVLAADNDYDVRTAVATSKTSLTRQLLRTLALDTNSSVREALLKRDDLDAEVLDMMVFDDNDDIRARVVAHPLLSERWRRLYRDLEARNPLSSDELRELASAAPLSRRLVAQHPDAPTRVLGKLARDADWHIREDVARHPRATPAMLKRLATEVDRDVRRAAAGNPNIQRALLQELVHDTDESVRLAAATHPRLPHSLRDILKAGAVRSLTRSVLPIDRLVVLTSGSCSSRELRRRRNWQSLHWEIRALVAKHPLTERAVLERLAGDANRAVRELAMSRLHGAVAS